MVSQNAVSPNQKFCLSLKRTGWSFTWDGSGLFAKCETVNRNASSRWYEITPGIAFHPQHIQFSPRVTSAHYKYSTDELYDSTETTAGHVSFSISETTVIGAAGGAAAFIVLLLVLLLLLLKKVKRQRKQIRITKEEIGEFLLGVPLHKAHATGINELFVLPYDTKLEIPKSDVVFCEPYKQRCS